MSDRRVFRLSVSLRRLISATIDCLVRKSIYAGIQKRPGSEREVWSKPCEHSFGLPSPQSRSRIKGKESHLLYSMSNTVTRVKSLDRLPESVEISDLRRLSGRQRRELRTV